jgi:benzil reductase ((S)-benzoin forming)
MNTDNLSGIPSEFTIVITGPTSGIGYELVKKLSKKGFNLILIGRNLSRLDSIIDKQSEQITKIEFDLDYPTKAESSKDLSSQIHNNIKNNKIIFVNNAASIFPIKKIGDFKQENMVKAFYVNLFSPVAVLEGIKMNKNWELVDLYIINISSGAENTPLAGWSVYCSSKSSAQMFFNVFQLEEPRNVKVDHIDPGLVDTNMQTTIRNSDSKDFPLVSKFIEAKRTNSLKSSETAAQEIILLIKNWIQTL